jgi:hypothetical protein
MAELLRYTQHLHTSHSLPIVDKSERVKLDVSSGDNVRSTVGVNHAQLTLLDFMKLTIRFASFLRRHAKATSKQERPEYVAHANAPHMSGKVDTTESH